MAKVKKQVRPKPKTVRKKRSSTSLLSRVSDIEHSDTISMIVYGLSGTGKTTFWSSFPGKTLVIICSGAKESGELKSIDPKDRSRIKPFYLESCDQILTLAEELENDTEYDNVVLDHASSVQDLRLAEILGLDRIPEQKHWGMATREEYTERTVNMKTYLRALLDLVTTKRVVIVAQEGSIGSNADADEDSLGTPTIGCALSKSVVGWLNPAADYIVETFIRPKMKIIKKTGGKTRKVRDGNKKEYCIRTAPDELYTTKFRVPKGYYKPDAIVDPTYEKVMKVINGTYQEPTTTTKPRPTKKRTKSN